jgi:hypothetical protein
MATEALSVSWSYELDQTAARVYRGSIGNVPSKSPMRS